MPYRKNYKKANYRRKPSSKKPTFAVNNLSIPFTNKKVNFSLMKRQIKTIVDGDKECKRKIVETIGVLLQDGHYSRNILGNIPQGTSTLARESEEIHLCALKGHMTFYGVWTGATFPTQIRSMLVRMKPEFYSGADPYASSIGSNNLYLNNAPGVSVCRGLIDPKKCQLLYDKLTVIKWDNNTTAPTAGLANLDYNIPLNMDYVYKTGSNYGNKYNLYWIHIAHAPNATIGTTNIVNVHENSQLIFKDK